jgi:hypothetical protein
VAVRLGGEMTRPEPLSDPGTLRAASTGRPVWCGGQRTAPRGAISTVATPLP